VVVPIIACPLKRRGDEGQATRVVTNWLPRYTGTPLEAFGEHVLLTTSATTWPLFARR
jgi:hypothetical protein